MGKIVVKVTEKEDQGLRLEQLRINLKMTQKAFAKALGISQGYLSQILLGKKNISYRILNSISKGFKKVNVQWILTGHGQIFKSDAVVEPKEAEATAVSANIFLIRHRWNQDQSEFGALLGGFTRNQVSNWERGRTDPDYEALSRLEALSGIPQKKIRTQELSRSEIPELPNPMQVPLPAPAVSLSDVYELQQEILRRVAGIEDILRILKEQDRAAGK